MKYTNTRLLNYEKPENLIESVTERLDSSDRKHREKDLKSAEQGAQIVQYHLENGVKNARTVLAMCMMMYVGLKKEENKCGVVDDLLWKIETTFLNPYELMSVAQTDLSILNPEVIELVKHAITYGYLLFDEEYLIYKPTLF
ncbi:MAG: hypothetical protein LUE98_04525 [Tannerellaceae bacterium]|nr:hypothetical protein [Tannerellaceae bacterium]